LLPPSLRFVRGVNPSKILKVAAACGVGFLVCLVYLPTFVSFLFHQTQFGSTTLPAKGVFLGLLSRSWLAAIYCLGEESPATVFRTVPKLSVFVPVVFVGLTFVAFGAWWKRKDGILLSLPTFLLLSLWTILVHNYDYGFYKVLTMFWPVMVVAIFVGMSRLLALGRGFARPALIAASVPSWRSLYDQIDHFRMSAAPGTHYSTLSS
jgi:hypothetical protein